MTDIIYAYRGTELTAKALKKVTVWNKAIGAKFSYLVTSELIPFLKDVIQIFDTAVAEDLAGRIICNLEYWNRMIEDCTALFVSDVNMVCENIDRNSWDPEYSMILILTEPIWVALCISHQWTRTYLVLLSPTIPG
ncbi:hypothetical protein BBP40_012067 [Aspergillus hancockii]|nr:hypothetical protein BBP40_012067 [Aspergillus hancockii]